MNKTYLYLLGAIIIAGIIWYGTQASPKSPADTADNTTTTESSSSLRELLAAGSPQECSYTDDTSTGTVFIANNRIRADFTAQTGSTTETGHMILKDEKLYVWTDGQTQGFVLDIDTESQGSADTLDLDEDMDYDCKAWRMDASKFQQPTNVTFSDMSSFTTGANGGFDFSGFGL